MKKDQLGNKKEFLEMKYITDKIKNSQRRLKGIGLKAMLMNCKVKSRNSTITEQKNKMGNMREQ